jgi:hypothetical protein
MRAYTQQRSDCKSCINISCAVDTYKPTAIYNYSDEKRISELDNLPPELLRGCKFILLGKKVVMPMLQFISKA